MRLPRPILALCLAALLFVQPVIALAWAAAEWNAAQWSALCLSSDDSDNSDRSAHSSGGHNCVLCERPTVAAPIIEPQTIAFPVEVIREPIRFILKPAATGPPGIQTQPQRSRAPPSLV